MKLIESSLNIKRITVMIQKEVAQRICAMPGSKEYGSISAAIGYFADLKMLFSVSPSCFYPKPEVHSAVLSMQMKQHDKSKAEQYIQTVRGLFAKRRKTVRSNLRHSFELTMEQANEIIQKAEIDENARAEILNVSDFMQISEEIVNIQKNIENLKGI
jgi:16S rRNA (adenine1518-N6/adenine1519-N6)-dimethyltransferase